MKLLKWTKATWGSKCVLRTTLSATNSLVCLEVSHVFMIFLVTFEILHNYEMSVIYPIKLNSDSGEQGKGASWLYMRYLLEYLHICC